MTISYKDVVIRSEVHKANMELVRELVAFHFPEVAGFLRTVNRSSHKDIMLRQIQAKNDPRQLSHLVRNNRMDELEEVLACPHPAMTEGIQNAASWAAQEGRQNILERLLKDPRTDVNRKEDNVAWSFLYLAVKQGHRDIVDLLLRHNAEVTTKELREAVFHHFNDIVVQMAPQSEPDDSVLHAACESGNWEMQDIIVRSFPDIPIQNDTLYWAIQGGHPDIVRDVLSREHIHPMEFVQQTEEGVPLNALNEATQQGHSAIVDILLADPRVDPSWNRNQAVRIAAREGHPDIVLKILQHPLPVRRSFLLKWVQTNQKKLQVDRQVQEGKRENHNALTQEEWAVVQHVDWSRGTTTDVGEFWQAAMHALGNIQLRKMDL